MKMNVRDGARTWNNRSKRAAQKIQSLHRTGQLDGQRFGVVDYPAFLIPA
jgi:hypothetical protein